MSGRGVGMDVVKTNIETHRRHRRRRVDAGPGHHVAADDPADAGDHPGADRRVRRRAVRHPADRRARAGLPRRRRTARAIEHVTGAPVYRLRGKLLPLVRLDDDARAAGRQRSDRDVYIAVLQAEGRRFGLVVDRVLNTEEIVVKPLAAQLKDIGVYAGATILGDGRVALILDVQSLARRASLDVAGGAAGAPAAGRGPAPRPSTGDRLLVAGGRRAPGGDPAGHGHPAGGVPGRPDRAGRQPRGRPVPRTRSCRCCGWPHLLGAYGDRGAARRVPVVVYTERGRSVALAVERIVDIVEDAADARSDFDDDGLTRLGASSSSGSPSCSTSAQAILAADPTTSTWTPSDGRVRRARRRRAMRGGADR